MKSKNFFQSLFMLVLSVTILFSSITIVYNVISYEILDIGPRYIDDYRCYDHQYSDKEQWTQEQEEDCLVKETEKAELRDDEDKKLSYAWSVSALIIALPMFLYFRKQEKK